MNSKKHMTKNTELTKLNKDLKKHNITGYQIAQKTGVDKSMIYKYLNGHHPAFARSLEILKAIEELKKQAK